MDHATFTTPDLTTFCRLDDLGLTLTGQHFEPELAALLCRPTEPNDWCHRCGCQGIPRGTVIRRLARADELLPRPLADNPTGVAVALDVLRSCAIEHQLPGVLFSLEMSKTEVVMRLLSAEARIKLADMRSGNMSDDDWTRLARRMSEISEAPLFIDDSLPILRSASVTLGWRRLREAGIAAVVSGAGPTVLALSTAEFPADLRADLGLATAASFADAWGVPAHGACSLDALALPGGDPLSGDVLVGFDPEDAHVVAVDRTV